MPNKHFDTQSLWTEADFESMSWHDNRIHGIAFAKNYELQFDIDYIFKWVLEGKYYKFWISPCTLVFENVYDVVIENSTTEIEVDVIERFNPRRPKNADYVDRDLEFVWVIETHGGCISFTSIGYKQYVRQSPKFLRQTEFEERGAICFDKRAFEEER